MKRLFFLIGLFNLSLISSPFIPNIQGFEENRGQLGDTEGNKVKEVIFYTKYKDFGVYITEKGVSYVIYRYEELPQAAGSNEIILPDKYQMPKDVKMHYSRIDIDLVNSSIERSNIEYKEELPGYSNYYLGHCPEGVLYVKSYREVRIKGVYEGIDWIWRYDERGELHHEFELSEESEPEAIKLKINYADYALTPDAKKLILSTPLGKIEDGFVIGHRSESMIFSVEVRYRDNGDGTIGYNVSNWDRSSKLIIDPPLSLTWGTYYGGDQFDRGQFIKTDPLGNVYVAGPTSSATFPLQNPGGGAYYQGTFGGTYDAFILKFTNSGVRQWATFYGGDQTDEGYSLTTDAMNNVFLTGYTLGGTFPLYNPGGGAYYQGTYGGGGDIYLVKFSNTGVRLWATYYGGPALDYGRSVSVDALDNLFLTGESMGGAFPLFNPGGGAYFQGTYGGGTSDAYILKFSSSGVRLWATFYGGENSDNVNSLSIDHLGNLFLAGSTASTTFPLYDAGGGSYYQSTHGGSFDVFILKFTNSGVRQWATYYGGSTSDDSKAISVDINNNIIITGMTSGGTFPLFDPGGGAYYQIAHGGGVDAFILRFTNSGVRQWATFYGGNVNDICYSNCVDAFGSIFITGYTLGGTFPLQNPGGGAYYQGTYGGGTSDIYVVKFMNNGAREWATFYGGNGNDVGHSLYTDPAGNLFVTGQTTGGTFPTYNPGGGAYFQGSLGGGLSSDAFILKFGDAVVPVKTISNNIPETFKLYQNYPNPFNPATNIRFDIQKTSKVRLSISDIKGKEILVLVNQNLQAGAYEVKFNATHLSTGVYFYKISADYFSDTKRMILLK